MANDNEPMMNEKPPQLLPSGVNWALAIVGKIQGVGLQPSEPAGLSEVVVQYASTQTQRWCELRMPVQRALQLASMLSAMRDDPRVVAIVRKNP